MVSHTKKALSTSNAHKQRRNDINRLSQYWLRKSIHVRLLPQTYKDTRKLAIDHEVTIQGLLEYFLCNLLDNEETALTMLKEYKEVLKRGEQHISASDIEDILKAIEESSPLNNDDIDK